MPVWTGTTTRGALPRPLGTEGVNRAAFLEYFDAADTKTAYLGVSNVFTVGQSISSGNLTLTAGQLVMSAAAAQIRGGSTSWAVRDNADANNNLLLSNAGALTVRAGLVVTAGGATVTAGDLTVTAGNVVLSTAAARLVPGATSFAVRNSGNTLDNLLILENGNVTARGTLTGASLPLLDAHVAAGDPHPTYLTQAEGDARYALVAGAGMTQTQGDARYLQLTGGSLTGLLTFNVANGRLAGGSTDFSIRDNANANDNLLVTNAGVVTIRAGLTVTAGGATITAGNLTITAGQLIMGAAASQVRGGSTSWAVRNNADNTDNLLITNAGVVTVRAGLTVSAGGITVTGNSSVAGSLGGITGLTVVSGGFSVSGNSTITGTLGGITGLTVASGGITVTTGGITVTGNSTITGTLGGLTGLTVASGGASITGNSTITGTLGGITTLTATTLAGTLSTAAQPNITSLGSLTGLTLASGQLLLPGGSAGSPSLYFDSGNGIYSAGTDRLNFATAGTVRMEIDPAGYVGLGVTPSASWYSLQKVLQIGLGGALSSYSNILRTSVSDNSYEDGVGTFRALQTAAATRIEMTGGQIAFYAYASTTTGSTQTQSANSVRYTAGGLSLDASAGIQMTSGRITTAQASDAVYWGAGDKYSGATAGVGSGGMQHYVGPSQFHSFFVSGEKFTIDANCVRAGADNNISCGLSTHRWTAVYSVNGTLQTSRLSDKAVLGDLAQGEALSAVLNMGRVFRHHYLRPGEIMDADPEGWPVNERVPDTTFEHVGFDADAVPADLLVAPGQVNPQNTAVIALAAIRDEHRLRDREREEMAQRIAALEALVRDLSQRLN